MEEAESVVLCEGFCRCCLKRGVFDEGYNLLDSVTANASNASYLDMLFSCFSFNVTFTELSVKQNLICDLCIAKLKNACAFKTQVEEARNEWRTKRVEAQREFPTYEERCDGAVDAVYSADAENVDEEFIIEENVYEEEDVTLEYLYQEDLDTVPAQPCDSPSKATAVNEPIPERTQLQNSPSETSDDDKPSGDDENVPSSKSDDGERRSFQNASPKKPTYTTNWDIIGKECGGTRLTKRKWREILYSKICVETKRCRVCRESFNNIAGLVSHLNKHFPVYTCDICGKSYATRPVVEMHITSHDNSVEYKCDRCGKVCKTITRYRYHTRKHANSLSYYCPLCPQRFKDANDKGAHLVAVHNAPAKPFKCPHCDQCFLVVGKLNTHVRRVHLKERNVTCDACDRSYFSRVELRMHRFYEHGGEPLYACAECGRGFARVNVYRRHVATHEEA